MLNMEVVRSYSWTRAYIVQISVTTTSLFRLKIFLLVTLQNKGWSTGVVHGPGPLKGSMNRVHRGGPWTWGPCFVYVQ